MISEIETLRHKERVQFYMNKVVKELIDRATAHDDSKLGIDEIELFDEFTPKLKECTYNSPEYNECLDGLKPALDHHYARNRHHPEHFPNGIKDMNLIDIIEMFCDWKSSSERQLDGNILKSIEVTQKRFGFTNELKDILENTAEWLE
jgi:hypothetical protein